MKALYPYPVYVATFSNGPPVRRSFFSPARKRAGELVGPDVALGRASVEASLRPSAWIAWDARHLPMIDLNPALTNRYAFWPFRRLRSNERGKMTGGFVEWQSARIRDPLFDPASTATVLTKRRVTAKQARDALADLLANLDGPSDAIAVSAQRARDLLVA